MTFFLNKRTDDFSTRISLLDPWNKAHKHRKENAWEIEVIVQHGTWLAQPSQYGDPVAPT